ncbi:MAG: outer membrane beta-barrel protein [Thiothrix sp.]|nr:outer membrane beta-barrel protein [Thiothrix sp.]HPE61758.1 outer membrane beta-barrel protein [Thiolinea sp.]
MKNRLGAVLILASLLANGAAVAGAGGGILYNMGLPQESHLYAGGSLGLASHGDYDDGTTGAGKLYAGLRANYLAGVEAGYMNLGDTETAGFDDGPNGEPGQGRNPARITSSTSGLYAAGIAYLPLVQNAELMGKLGAMYWDRDSDKRVERTGEYHQDSSSGLSPLLGVGAQYQLGQNLHIRGEWEHVFGAGQDDYESSVDLLSLGVTLSTY